MTVEQPGNTLIARRIGIDTQSEPVALLNKESPVCRAEGFEAHSRVLLTAGPNRLIATLYQVSGDFVRSDEAGLSEEAWRRLGLREGDAVTVSHPEPIASMAFVRSRIYGHELTPDAIRQIIFDITGGRYSNVEIGAFLTACAAKPLNSDEVNSLTRAMVDAGDRLSWKKPIIADKHSVGGLPGNRTTPIVVAIVTSLGVTMPKTSSRAITSPAGTADTMETLAPIDLDTRAIHRVVEQEGGCIAWGGAVRLSPADDILIRVERALEIDTEGQMIASVLSKKIAAGATHLVMDMPVGPTAKVRTPGAAEALTSGLLTIAEAFGIKAKIIASDGTQPVGYGIGPALEARDVLAVFRGDAHAPRDLRERAVLLSGAVLELTGSARVGEGRVMALDALVSGCAWQKFQRICEAQGGMRTPPTSNQRHEILSTKSGRLTTIDNRKIAKLAKLAGAPEDKPAGVELHLRVGDAVAEGQPLCTVHAVALGELEYALAYASATPDIFAISGA